MKKIHFSKSTNIDNLKMPEYVTNFGIHQVSDNAFLKGYSKNLDLDMAFRNYPQIIYNRGLNNTRNANVSYTDSTRKGLQKKLIEI